MNTCRSLIQILFYYEQEYFKYNKSEKLDMLTQLVRICQVLNMSSQDYKDELDKIETDPEYDSRLYKEL